MWFILDWCICLKYVGGYWVEGCGYFYGSFLDVEFMDR